MAIALADQQMKVTGGRRPRRDPWPYVSRLTLESSTGWQTRDAKSCVAFANLHRSPVAPSRVQARADVVQLVLKILHRFLQTGRLPRSPLILILVPLVEQTGRARLIEILHDPPASIANIEIEGHGEVSGLPYLVCWVMQDFFPSAVWLYGATGFGLGLIIAYASLPKPPWHSRDDYIIQAS